MESVRGLIRKEQKAYQCRQRRASLSINEAYPVVTSGVNGTWRLIRDVIPAILALAGGRSDRLLCFWIARYFFLGRLTQSFQSEAISGEWLQRWLSTCH
jgi:hypothetical protein